MGAELEEAALLESEPAGAVDLVVEGFEGTATLADFAPEPEGFGAGARGLEVEEAPLEAEGC